MTTKGFILVEGLTIKDLVRAYNRDRTKIERVTEKMGTSRIKALRQGIIKEGRGFENMTAKVKSEKGNWEYNIVVKVSPGEFKYYFCSFTIIDDPVRPKKREIIIWEMLSRDRNGNTVRTPIIYKQHALERYYQRHLGEEFPGIKEAATYIIMNELIINEIGKDISGSPGITMKQHVSLAVRSGQFLAYKNEDEELIDRDKPLIVNTFVGNKEIEEGQRTNQLVGREFFDSVVREKSQPQSLIFENDFKTL